jgi:hypothetical protein
MRHKETVCFQNTTYLLHDRDYTDLPYLSVSFEVLQLRWSFILHDAI